MKQVFRKILSLVILLAFFFSTTPHDFLHQLFANHKDTVDTYHRDAWVSNRHIHCAFLHIVLSHYVADAPLHFTCYQHIYHNLPVSFPGSYLDIFRDGPSLRAPPFSA